MSFGLKDTSLYCSVTLCALEERVTLYREGTASYFRYLRDMILMEFAADYGECQVSECLA